MAKVEVLYPASFELRLDRLEAQVEMLAKHMQGSEQLLKYVVTPLLLIVGALVGVKLVV